MTKTTRNALVVVGAAWALVACGGELDPAAAIETDFSVTLDPSFVETGVEPLDEVMVPEEAPDEPLPEGVGTHKSALFGSGACKNVDISVTNSRARSSGNVPILVQKVEAYSSTDGKWRSENLSNLIVPYGFIGTWYNKDLEYLGGDVITKWRISYKYLMSNGNWSSRYTQVDDTPNRTCLDNSSHGMTVD